LKIKTDNLSTRNKSQLKVIIIHNLYKLIKHK